MGDEKCFICEKHKNVVDIVFQDSMVSVSHMVRRSDNYLGYYMVESIRHFKGMYDATDEEMKAMGKMLKTLSKALMNILNGACICICYW